MSGRRGSNSRPLAWKANALSTELLPQKQTDPDCPPPLFCNPAAVRHAMCPLQRGRRIGPTRFALSGKRWIRTTEGVRQQIYSLPHLATLVSSRIFNCATVACGVAVFAPFCPLPPFVVAPSCTIRASCPTLAALSNSCVLPDSCCLSAPPCPIRVSCPTLAALSNSCACRLSAPPESRWRDSNPRPADYKSAALAN